MLNGRDPRVLSPVQFLEKFAPPPQDETRVHGESKPIDFIDLKTQQDLVRPGLETNIHRVLHHGQYIMGPEVKQLEEKLAAFTGSAHAVTCASGTDALLIALMALDIGPGDEVITVPYTWISTAEVIALLRAKPVFVDIDPDTFNMDPARIEAAITPKTRAIMPVSLYGQCADMTRINRIAGKHGVPVIEDAAQSFGATHHGKKSGALSDIGCTSFFPSKPLGCYGDGGALFTDDDGLAEKMRQIRVHGQKVKHQHPMVGINGRLDTVQAAILLEELDLFPEECRLRWTLGKRYDDLLSGISGIQTPTDHAVKSLDREGIVRRVHQVGDVMYDSVLYNAELAKQRSDILARMELTSGEYELATVHRAENTDDPVRLAGIFEALATIARDGLRVAAPLHPRTRKKLAEAGLAVDNIEVREPLPYLDMLMLEMNARVIVTDSGGVQKEAYWFGVPCVTVRDETEWVETVESGWNRVVGYEAGVIVGAVRGAVPAAERRDPYGDGGASERVAMILSG